MKKILSDKWFKFGIVACIYLLWVIWNTNYWWLFGLPVIFDIYITKKVHWAFWKKKGVKKQTKVIEWVDAIIFAVIAASLIRTFIFEMYTIPTSSMEKSLLVGDYLLVSKSAYGPRKPITPLSVPFVHHSLPLTNNSKKSFIEAWQRDYFRMKGYRTIKNNDVVVFNFPEGDTVCVENQAPSYYQLCRDMGRNNVWNRFTVVHRPVDKCENYVKRCVAIPGDSIKIVDGQLFVNNKKQEPVGKIQYRYSILTDGSNINPKALQKLGVAIDDISQGYMQPGYYRIPLTTEVANRISTFNIVRQVIKENAGDRDGSGYVFPHDSKFKWNEDNYGPLWIPKKGATINLTIDNLPIYKRIIGHYEGNTLKVADSVIYINNEPASSYTFKMDYYWMMGDNRHNSLDSRFWGFVPEDHVVGRAAFVWLSLDKDQRFPKNLRFKNMFKFVHN